jgi:hypothetical protein
LWEQRSKKSIEIWNEFDELTSPNSLDPYQVDDYSHPGVIGVKVFNTWLHGISSFYRLGTMSLSVIDNSAVIGKTWALNHWLNEFEWIFVELQIGTQEIEGKTTWEVNVAKGMITRSGNVRFTVQHIKVSFKITQPLDLSKRLLINDIQLELGNIQVRSNGLGTADYLVELFVNVLPNLLRYQIVDALEKPLTRRLQEITDRIDMEEIVKELVEEYRTTGKIDPSKLEAKLEL